MMISANEMTVVAAAFTGITGMVSGVAVGAWWVSARSERIDQHEKAIETINSRCEAQRKEMLADLERTICSGIKAALKDLEAQRLQQRVTDREEMAELRSMVNQHDADIREIFIKLDHKRLEQ